MSKGLLGVPGKYQRTRGGVNFQTPLSEMREIIPGERLGRPSFQGAGPVFPFYEIEEGTFSASLCEVGISLISKYT